MTQPSNDKYKQDGVDISTGDAFSSFCGEICRSTYGNSPFVDVHDLSRGNFRGPRGFTLKGLPEGCIMSAAVDGVGTKVVPIVASGKPETAASDVIGMTGMDITRYGGLPLIFLNILDVRSLGEMDSENYKMCQQLMLGLQTVAKQNNYIVLGGETAELGVCVGSEDPNAKLMFNWGGAMIGVYHPYHMIYGDTLRPGQIIVAFQDNFRSNGWSLGRNALKMHYGDNWYNNPAALADIIAATTPSAQYDRFFNEAHGWFGDPVIPMHLIVHLSGGAFESKLGNDILKPQGLSAELFDLFEPSEIMKKIAQWRGLPDEECYKALNGGQGAIAVVDSGDLGRLFALSDFYGIPAKVAGQITEKRDYTVAIKSKFGSDKLIYY